MRSPAPGQTLTLSLTLYSTLIIALIYIYKTLNNYILQAWAAESAGFAHFLDLGAGFLSAEPVAGKLEVKEALMPDSLHPSAVGMRIVAAQLEPLVAGLVASHRAPDHHHAEGGTASS